MFRRTLISLFIILLLITSVSAIENDSEIQQVSKIPHSFYGTIYIDEQPAPKDSIVSAYCVGIKQTNQSYIELDSNGSWGCIGNDYDPFGNLLTVQGTIEPNSPITFFINGIPTFVRPANTSEWLYTYPYISGKFTHIELMIPSFIYEQFNQSNSTDLIITPIEENITPTEFPTALPTTTPTTELQNSSNETDNSTSTPIIDLIESINQTPEQKYSSEWTHNDTIKIQSMKNSNNSWVVFVGNYFDDMKNYWYDVNYTPQWDKINATQQTDPILYSRIIRTIEYAENKSYQYNPNLNTMIDAQNWDWLHTIGITWSDSNWTRFRLQEYTRYGLPSIYCPPVNS